MLVRFVRPMSFAYQPSLAMRVVSAAAPVNRHLKLTHYRRPSKYVKEMPAS